MMRRFCAALCAVLPAVITCDNGAVSNRATVATDSAGITIVANDIPQTGSVCEVSAEPDVAIGAVEAGEAYELYRVFGASQLSDGRIVLVNQSSHELRFYDGAGRHLMSSGRGGRGPGEFQNAFQLWVLPGDTIHVGDYRPWQFHVFAPDGRWVRTVRPRPEYGNPPGVIEVLDDGRSLLAVRPSISAGPNWSVRHLTVVMHAPDGSVLDTIGSYENGRWGTVSGSTLGLYPLFESFARIDASGRTLLIAHSSEAQYAVHEADAAVVLTRIVRWNAGTRAITTQDIDAERRRLAEPYTDMDPSRRRELVDPLISTERPVADRFPAFVSLRLARDGRVWIRDFVRPTEAPEQRWLVFDVSGTFACRAVLPEEAEVLELGADYVLALRRNEEDVERVVKHSIGVPANVASAYDP
jgi:hypothetical protein